MMHLAHYFITITIVTNPKTLREVTLERRYPNC
jgi:hypothetical protein